MKFLIIGAGMIGAVHAEALHSLGDSFAFCDSREENAAALGRKYGITELYGDYREAILQAGADAAIVCTPNHLHAGPTIFALEHGMDVLCEKPMASSCAQAQEMYRAQQASGRTLMIGYIVRNYAALNDVKEVLDGGRLGRVISMRCVLATPETLDLAKTTYRKSYETGGGIIYDYTHEIDYCRYLLGEPCKAAAFCGSYLRRAQSADDSADILMKFHSGAVLELHMDYLQSVGRCGRSRSFEIVCENGVVACDFKSVQVDFNDGSSEKKQYELDWNRHFVIQANRFKAVLRGEAPPYVTARDGLRILEIADKLYESAAKEQFVSL